MCTCPWVVDDEVARTDDHRLPASLLEAGDVRERAQVEVLDGRRRLVLRLARVSIKDEDMPVRNLANGS